MSQNAATPTTPRTLSPAEKAIAMTALPSRVHELIRDWADRYDLFSIDPAERLAMIEQALAVVLTDEKSAAAEEAEELAPEDDEEIDWDAHAAAAERRAWSASA